MADGVLSPRHALLKTPINNMKSKFIYLFKFQAYLIHGGLRSSVSSADNWAASAVKSLAQRHNSIVKKGEVMLPLFNLLFFLFLNLKFRDVFPTITVMFKPMETEHIFAVNTSELGNSKVFRKNSLKSMKDSRCAETCYRSKNKLNLTYILLFQSHCEY